MDINKKVSKRLSKIIRELIVVNNDIDRMEKEQAELFKEELPRLRRQRKLSDELKEIIDKYDIVFPDGSIHHHDGTIEEPRKVKP